MRANSFVRLEASDVPNVSIGPAESVVLRLDERPLTPNLAIIFHNHEQVEQVIDQLIDAMALIAKNRPRPRERTRPEETAGTAPAAE